jgi:hypothetical protein
MSGFSLAALKNTLDEVRVSVYAKNETEKKVLSLATATCSFVLFRYRCASRLQVYEALSSKNWGASSTQMNEIAAETSE